MVQKQASPVILWMDEILHHFETMANHYLLVFIGESSFQVLFGGAGFRPSTVTLRFMNGLVCVEIDNATPQNVTNRYFQVLGNVTVHGSDLGEHHKLGGAGFEQPRCRVCPWLTLEQMLAFRLPLQCPSRSRLEKTKCS